MSADLQPNILGFVSTYFKICELCLKGQTRASFLDRGGQKVKYAQDSQNTTLKNEQKLFSFVIT